MNMNFINGLRNIGFPLYWEYWNIDPSYQGDGSIPGKYCKIFMCYVFDISLEFQPVCRLLQIVIACVTAMALAEIQYTYGAPSADSDGSYEIIPIVKDDRYHEDDGTYSFDFESANGIKFSQSGTPDGDDDAVIKAGEYSWVLTIRLCVKMALL